MKLQHIMETVHMIHESVQYGWAFDDLSYGDWDVEPDGSDSIKMSTAFGEDGDVPVHLDVSIDVDGQMVDNGIGPNEYWGSWSNDEQWNAEGEVEVTGFELDLQAYDDEDLAKLAKFLRVPERLRTDRKMMVKYFNHCLGDTKKVIKWLEQYLHDNHEETVHSLIDDKANERHDDF